MIDAKRLALIRERYGGQGSWAVWAPVPALSDPPKSQVGDMDVLDERLNPALLEVLKPEVVMVGLNFGRRDPGKPAEPFRNFHSASPWAHDFKIRYAFSGRVSGVHT
jgi:hypothetical protein